MNARIVKVRSVHTISGEPMELHPQLQKDCAIIGQFSLSLVLLMNESRYPWFILVPQRANIRELCELTTPDQHQLMNESSQFARAMITAFAPDKLNIAAIGNIVPQLHVHHIARYHNDAAWPKPVWGAFPPVPYTDAARSRLIASLLTALSQTSSVFTTAL